MTTADYALIVSLCSAAFALAALVWNVWQKFIFVKPAVQVTVHVSTIFAGQGAGKFVPAPNKLVSLHITNLGPGPVTVHSCIMMNGCAMWPRSRQYAVISPIHGDPTVPKPIGIGPFGGGLPKKIEAGEIASFYFPYEKGIFLDARPKRIGINDTYGRNIWVRRRDRKTVVDRYFKDFG